jgi:SAM-dependent methyltransferase
MSEQFTSEVIHSWRGDYLSEMPPARRIVSAGCAGSWYFDWFAEKYPHPVDRHVGFELQPPPADLPSGVVWIQGNIRDLSAVETASVDLVFAGQVIEHLTIDEFADFLCEVNRVLDDEGFFVLDSPNFAITNLIGMRNPEHNVEYTCDQIRSLLQASGFEIQDVKGMGLCVDPVTKHCWGFDYQTERHRRELLAPRFPEHCLIWWVTANKHNHCVREHIYPQLEEFERLNSSATRTSLRHNVGVLVPDSEASRGVALYSAVGDSPGYLLFGPYIPLPKGDYEVTFHIKLRAPGPTGAWPHRLLRSGIDLLLRWRAPRGGQVAAIDACSGAECEVHASRAIHESDFADSHSYHPFSLSFSSDGEEHFQFRVYSFGREPLFLDPYTPYRCFRRL